MPSFKKGEPVSLNTGKSAIILNEKPLGSGGQGEVYLVSYDGAEYALKWYTSMKIRTNPDFKENLMGNARIASPNERFAWPVAVTDDYKGSYGYVMRLLPKENYEFSDFLRSYKLTKGDSPKKIPVRMADFGCLLNSAFQIVECFMDLHRLGKSYQDLNDGGISMNMSTGDIIICDCDNIASDGKNFGINGKQGYMAPEIILHQNPPNVYSDRFSLAVILFKLFFRDDPFWGKKVNKCCNLTDYNYRKFYAEEPVFIYHPTDHSNCPKEGVSDNAIRLWKRYPDYIHDLFVRAFVDGIRDTSKRPLETEWISALVRLRSEAFTCSCGGFSFVSEEDRRNASFICPRCRASYPLLKLGSTCIPVAKGAVAYKCQLHVASDDHSTVSLKVVENRHTKGLIGIKNVEDVEWEVRYDDSKKTVRPNDGAEIKPGMRIEFDFKTTGSVLRSD